MAFVKTGDWLGGGRGVGGRGHLEINNIHNKDFCCVIE